MIEWQAMDTAPRDASNFRVLRRNGAEVEPVHYASDLSGSEQPPFQGFFRPIFDESGRLEFYAGVEDAVAWAPLTTEKQDSDAAGRTERQREKRSSTEKDPS